MLQKGIVHCLVQAKRSAEILSQISQIVPLMDANPACLGRSNIHIDIQKQALLLGLCELWWLDLRKFDPVKLLSSHLLLCPLCLSLSFFLSPSQSVDLLLIASWHVA